MCSHFCDMLEHTNPSIKLIEGRGWNWGAALQGASVAEQRVFELFLNVLPGVFVGISLFNLVQVE